MGCSNIIYFFVILSNLMIMTYSFYERNAGSFAFFDIHFM